MLVCSALTPQASVQNSWRSCWQLEILPDALRWHTDTTSLSLFCSLASELPVRWTTSTRSRCRHRPLSLAIRIAQEASLENNTIIFLFLASRRFERCIALSLLVNVFQTLILDSFTCSTTLSACKFSCRLGLFRPLSSPATKPIQSLLLWRSVIHVGKSANIFFHRVTQPSASSL